jgi:choline dehydrogenase-like flavoprotein
MQSYDSIIAGGGPAGWAMARRLSDNPAVRVHLLEEGCRRVYMSPRRHSGIRSRGLAKRPKVNITVLFNSKKCRRCPGISV